MSKDNGGIFRKILKLGEDNEISRLVAEMKFKDCDKYAGEVMKKLAPYKNCEIDLKGNRLLRGGLLTVYADGEEIAKLGYGEDDWDFGIELEARLEKRLKQNGYRLKE